LSILGGEGRERRDGVDGGGEYTASVTTNIFSRIFLLVVTKSIYKLCWYKHNLPEKMFIPTDTV